MDGAGLAPDSAGNTGRRWELDEVLTRRLIFLSGLVLAAAAATVLCVLDPAESRFRIPCPFHYVTGLHCPGCGSTRAAHQLLRGKLFVALGYNPLMVLASPLVGYAFISYGIRAFGKQRAAVPVRACWLWGLVALILVYWVARNIPLYPLTLLAP